jgi:hypothetical protein
MAAAFTALGLLLARRKQDVLAGICLALATIKPPMVLLLLPFVLIWSASVRRRELFWSIVLSVFVLLLASVVLLPNWPIQWATRLYTYFSSDLIQGSPVAVAAGSMPGLSQQLTIFLAASLGIYLVIEWVLAIGKDERWFLWTAMMTIVVSNLLGIKTGISNYLLLIPVLFLIFQAWEHRWQTGGQIISIVFLLLLGAGMWALWLANQDLLAQPGWLIFPLPLICLVGLWWVRWWFVHPPRLYIEELARKVG